MLLLASANVTRVTVRGAIAVAAFFLASVSLLSLSASILAAKINGSMMALILSTDVLAYIALAAAK